jgi:hypothetical protein
MNPEIIDLDDIESRLAMEQLCWMMDVILTESARTAAVTAGERETL